MSTRRRLVIGAATAAAVAGLAIPANADPGDTPVTFALTSGGLAIATPTATATLVGGSIASIAGAAVQGSIGSTTVTDARGGVVGWKTTMKGTAFSNGTGDGFTTIPVGNVKAFVPVTDAVTGLVSSTGVVTATALPYVTAATGLPLTTTAQDFVTATLVVGSNSATFAPSLNVSIPANATAGTYTGTVTQTVS